MSTKLRAQPGEFFYRHAGPRDGAPSMVHIHGFAISGSYLLPTAALLTDDFDTYVPDLPGYGRTPGPRRPLGITALADSVVEFLDSVGLERTTLVGNSMGCPVIGRLSERHPDRVERAILVSPAGGMHSRPLGRGLSQLAVDGLREPPSLIKTAGPDYVRFGILNGIRLFSEMTQSPTIELLMRTEVPLLVVLGSRDPLLPGRKRIAELAPIVDGRGNLGIVRMNGPAHAINFSHPETLAQVIRAYMADPRFTDPSQLPDDVEVLARPHGGSATDLQ